MSKLKRKYSKWLIIPIVIVAIIILYPIADTLYIKYDKNKYLEETFDTIYRNFKVKFNKEDYKVESVRTGGSLFSNPDCYQIVKKEKVKYDIKKSEFEEGYDCIRSTGMHTKEGVEFFEKEELSTMLYLMAYDGFIPYFYNEFIYDKSKGNDFRQIEKILSKYDKYLKQESVSYSTVVSGDLICDEISYVSVFFNVIDADKKTSDCSDSSLFEKYFSVERNFNTIDWYDFKKQTNIHPILVFRFELEKEELKKIFKEMRPYYNKEEYSIVLADENLNEYLDEYIEIEK